MQNKQKHVSLDLKYEYMDNLLIKAGKGILPDSLL